MDNVIGGVLGRVDANADGVWSVAPVQDLVEELESDPFDSGIFA